MVNKRERSQSTGSEPDKKRSRVTEEPAADPAESVPERSDAPADALVAALALVLFGAMSVSGPAVPAAPVVPAAAPAGAMIDSAVTAMNAALEAANQPLWERVKDRDLGGMTANQVARAKASEGDLLRKWLRAAAAVEGEAEKAAFWVGRVANYRRRTQQQEEEEDEDNAEDNAEEEKAEDDKAEEKDEKIKDEEKTE
ncbi:hypothetical protein G7054_g9508 [Neopestalotiopsis clavispora]|nr:hypothetical protein G7054_g9508 [Neopestalotiopsis clavispora]